MEKARQYPFVESRSFKWTFHASVRIGQFTPVVALIAVAVQIVTPELAIEVILAAWAAMFALMFLAAYFGGELPGSNSKKHARQTNPGCFWSLITFCGAGFVIMFGLLALMLTGAVL